MTEKKGRSKKINKINFSKHPLVCIDFDGTIAKHPGKFEAIKGSMGPPIKGAAQIIRIMKEVYGWTILIWTTRGDSEELRNYLRKHNILFDFINKIPNAVYIKNSNEGKPPAILYIDDHALHFDGDWGKTLEKASYFVHKEKELPHGYFEGYDKKDIWSEVTIEDT